MFTGQALLLLLSKDEATALTASMSHMYKSAVTLTLFFSVPKTFSSHYFMSSTVFGFTCTVVGDMISKMIFLLYGYKRKGEQQKKKHVTLCVWARLTNLCSRTCLSPVCINSHHCSHPWWVLSHHIHTHSHIIFMPAVII